MKREISAIDRQQELKRIEKKLVWLQKKKDKLDSYIQSTEYKRKLKIREYANKKHRGGLFRLIDQPEYKKAYMLNCAIKKWRKKKLELMNSNKQSPML